ncbi:Sucrose nonfermenting 4 protein [Spatholobus suberectus]|nr:Sucrose nonfermenting 4 protein [Spatholobus suberectus]
MGWQGRTILLRSGELSIAKFPLKVFEFRVLQLECVILIAEKVYYTACVSVESSVVFWRIPVVNCSDCWWWWSLAVLELRSVLSFGVVEISGVEMFGAGRGAGSGGVAGPVLIPKRFVWPHGGRRVFLSGSFTRWSVFIPMSPMEGCPTVFQVICSLTPGYHQYKFNVDGEWRHDEHQPLVRGDYGIVNTIYLVREPDILPPILNAETPGRSHMEVDNDVFGHVEASPRMSESDLQVSRHRISIFLSTDTAYELLPESGKVIALDITLPVKQAFHALYQEGISMAPVWDSSKCQFVGMLSAMDFILILKEMGNLGSNLTEEQLETHTIAAWREEKGQECRTDSNGRTYPQHLVHAGPHECLKDVALKFYKTR